MKPVHDTHTFDAFHANLTHGASYRGGGRRGELRDTLGAEGVPTSQQEGKERTASRGACEALRRKKRVETLTNVLI